MNTSVTTKPITSVAELSAAVTHHIDQDADNYPFFRGMASSRWNLRPKVFRDGHIASEYYYTTNFKRLALSRHAECPRHDDYSGWLSMMQHYGLPTRLLDWTESALAAAYFAVCHDQPKDTKDDDAIVWCLNPTRLNVYQNIHFGIPDLSSIEQSTTFRRLVKGAFYSGFGPNSQPPEGDDVGEMVAAVLCDEVDIRIAVQRGTFTIHNSNLPLEDKATAHQFLTGFTIPAAAKSRFAEELEMLGMCRMNLFPDLHNLAIDLQHQVIDLKRR